MNYTIYVFNPSIKDFDEVVKPASLHLFERVPINQVNFKAQAYLQRNKTTPPGWLENVLPYCAIVNPQTILNQNSSLIIAKSGTFCAVTHGQGFLKLNSDKIIEGYGLDLAHRVVEPTEIKSIDSKGIGAGSLQKRHVSSRTNDLSAFPFNYYRDRIKRIDGKTKNGSCGRRFSGSTSCRIVGEISFPELGDLCEEIIAARKSAQHKRFSITQPYSEVKDAALIAELWNKFAKEITSNKGKALGAFLPEIDDWDRAVQFQLSYDNGTFRELSDLDPIEISAHVSSVAGKKVDPSKIMIRGIDDDGHDVFDQPFEELATFEISHKAKPYALSDGKWFLLDQGMVDCISARITEIELITDPKYLPAWDKKDADEAAYNLKVDQQCGHRVQCLDRETINVAGHGAVEPCDHATIEGDLIHVKKWRSSQQMSALLKQGENSAMLARNYQDFRRGLLAKLKPSWKKIDPWNFFDVDFRAPNHRIVYAIPHKSKSFTLDDLPIFSKISVVETYARLRADNFDVAFCHIPLK